MCAVHVRLMKLRGGPEGPIALGQQRRASPQRGAQPVQHHVVELDALPQPWRMGNVEPPSRSLRGGALGARAGGRARPQDQMASFATWLDIAADAVSQADAPKLQRGPRASRARGTESNTPPRGRGRAAGCSARIADNAISARHLR
jgi:hypothetical protein